MSRSLRVVWDDKLTEYDFGHGHPLAPIRVELAIALARSFGVLELDGVSLEAPTIAGPDLLTLIHSPQYIEAVQRAGVTGAPDPVHGLGIPDNPVFSGMHDAAALIVGATVAAAEAVWSGASEHAVNIAGGLHHAMRSAAEGFCIYNDPAIAIAWLLRQGATRIGYVDLDVHHGDGVQEAFYSDPRVLTISLHESPRTLFPGTGFAGEIGAIGAEGYAVNVALPAGTGDSGWLRAFDAVVPPLLTEFRPQVLVTQHGCDTHTLDPLANLNLTIDAQRAAAVALHHLAHQTSDGKWVITGGGGYELVQVVPRTWTHLLSEAAGRPIEPATAIPEEWRTFTAERTGEIAPKRMTDGGTSDFRPFAAGYDPADAVDRAIIATRKAVFPYHGLDPEP